MPKKNMTQEEKDAWVQKMKDAKAKKLKAAGVEREVVVGNIEEPIFGSEHPEPSGETISRGDYNALLEQINEIKAMGFDNLMKNTSQGATVTTEGVKGTVSKYGMDPNLYPDPSERLANEEKLRRFAFKENYTLTYEVGVTSYETKTGINMQEPKFTLQLNRIIYDPDTGVDTNKRYVVCRLIMHEDPQSALVVARENDLEIDEDGEIAFLNEMRYIQMRNWLLESFYPPKSTAGTQVKEEVIDGQLVQVFEVSSEKPTDMPFDKLDKKIRA